MDHNNHNNVTKPWHYQFSKPCVDVKDVIKDRNTRVFKTKFHNPDIYYDLDNLIKYVLRWQDKNGIEDLRKAEECLSSLLRILENGKDSTNQSAKCESSNDVPMVDLDKLWEQEHMKVHPTIKEQYAEALNKLGHTPIARFPPWT